MKKIINYCSLNTDVATLVLRLVFGGLFIRYGYMKLVSFDEMLSMFQDIIGIGIKPSLILVIFAEFFCGILVTIGLFTRFAVIPIFITMFVAYFIAHANDTFDVKALAFVFLLLSIVVFILGGGKYSVDRLLSRKG